LVANGVVGNSVYIIGIDVNADSDHVLADGTLTPSPKSAIGIMR